jgi:hypothetical protein
MGVRELQSSVFQGILHRYEIFIILLRAFSQELQEIPLEKLVFKLGMNSR